MNKKWKTGRQWLGVIFVLFAMCLSCGGDDVFDDDNENGPSVSIDEEVEEEFETNPNEDIESEVETDGIVKIIFDTQSATVTNPYEGKGVTITQNGADVTVKSTLSDEICYLLSGSTTEGSLKIYSDTKFELLMNGVSIVNSDDPALNIQSGKKATITLAEGTSNRIAGGTSFASEGGSEDMKAALFSEGKLVFAGTGNLVVMGRYRHAICSDDYVRIEGGNISVSMAAKDGIHANDYIEMTGGTVNIQAIGDGLDSEGYITLSGGSLNVTTTGEKGHGVKSAAETTVETTGNIDIQVKGAASKAFKCGGDMLVSNGTIRLTTSGDAFYDSDEADISSPAGIKCDGNLTITGGDLILTSSGSGGKGISVDGTITVADGVLHVTTTGGIFKYQNDDTAAKAVKCDGDMTINGGVITIRTSGQEAEGLESKAHLVINNGSIDIEAYDDCINASNSIVINGGDIYCYSVANDGIDSNGTLTVTGGTIVSVGTSSPEEGIDCDRNTFKITGGTLLGVGGATSSPTSNVCTQYALVYSGSGFTQNTNFNITSSDGKEVLTYTIPRTLNSMTILFSSPALQKGASYTISKSGVISGGTSFHGLYSGATYSGGTTLSTFMVSSIVTTVGSSGNNPGGNGFPGNGGFPGGGW